METKVCSCCKRELPVNLFVRNRTRKDGLGCWCKECNNKYNKRYRKNREKMGWYDRFDIYIMNNRLLDSELIKDWQRCIKVLRESPSKTKEEVIRECNPRYSDEFRQMITYLVTRGFIQKEGYGVSTRYTIPTLVENKFIQEWYQDFRLRYPHLIYHQIYPQLEESTDKTAPITFDSFWDIYGYKKEKKACVALWNKLSEDEKSEAYWYVPEYKASTDKKYILKPYNYLYRRKWEDNNVINSRKMLEDKMEIKPAPVTFTVSYEKSELCKHFDSLTLQRVEAGMYSYEELAAIKYLQDNGFEVKKIIKLELD